MPVWRSTLRARRCRASASASSACGWAARLPCAGRSRCRSALVVGSVSANIQSARGNRLAHDLGPPGRLLTPVYTALMPPVIHAHARELRPIDRIGEAKAPVFVMSGAADIYTTIAASEAMVARARTAEQFRPVDGAARLSSWRTTRRPSIAAVLEFFANFLPLTPR